MGTKKKTKKAPTAKAPGKTRNVKNIIPAGDKSISVYASPRISKALHEVTEEMTLYNGVRFAQILEAVYAQGQKDGARNVFELLDKKVKEAQKTIPYRNPGQPRKPKK